MSVERGEISSLGDLGRKRKRVIIVDRNADGSISDNGEVVTTTDVVVRKIRWRRKYEATIYRCESIMTVEAQRADLLGKAIKHATSDLRGVSIHVTPEAKMTSRQKAILFDATSKRAPRKPKVIIAEGAHRNESPHDRVLVHLPRIVN